MRKMEIRHWSFHPIIGIGYWKDTYTKELCGLSGVTHNIIILFIRIQFGYLLELDEE